MAKQNGLGDNLYLGAYNVSNDVRSVDISSPIQTIDVTGIDKSAIERIGGLRSGAMSFVAVHNPALSHIPLSALPTSDVLLTYARGTALGSQTCSLVAKQIGYDPTRSDAGELTFAVEAQSNGYGAEWGVLLTAGVRTDSGATNGAQVDDIGTSTSFGGTGYLHVTGGSGSLVVTIQGSSDGSTWTDILSFTTVTAVGYERKQTSTGTTFCKRYLRAITTGTYTTPWTFIVTFARNISATVY